MSILASSLFVGSQSMDVPVRRVEQVAGMLIRENVSDTGVVENYANTTEVRPKCWLPLLRFSRPRSICIRFSWNQNLMGEWGCCHGQVMILNQFCMRKISQAGRT